MSRRRSTRPKTRAGARRVLLRGERRHYCDFDKGDQLISKCRFRIDRRSDNPLSIPTMRAIDVALLSAFAV